MAAPVTSLVVLGAYLPDVLDAPVRETATWIPQLGLSAAFRLDVFGLLVGLLVAVVGICVLLAGWAKPEPDAGRLAGLLAAFAGVMTGLVLADDVLLLYVFWEATSVLSFLLVGGDGRSARARAAARHALLVTGAGGLALLGGLVTLASAAGTTSLSAILADPPRGGAVGLGVALLVLGALTKSAQVPFHGWLPGAMVAPTPVSAYLHSATMVKAGVVLLARFAPGFAEVPTWQLATVAGAVSLVWGGVLALRTRDLKRLLAFTTISTLGLLVLLFGVGTPKAILAGTAVLLAHGAGKAALFLLVGGIEKASGTRDVDLVPRLAWPVVAATALAAASVAGLPPLLGFPAKEAGLEAVLGLGSPAGAALAVAVVAGAALAAAATYRVVGVTIRGGARGPAGKGRRRVPSLLLLGPGLLALLSLAGGVATPVANALVRPAADGLVAGADEYALKLWPGATLALGLSALAAVAGILLVRWLRPPAAVREGTRRDAEAVFEHIVAGVIRLAHRVTAVTQDGSLPTTLLLVLATLLLVPGTALLRASAVPADLPLADSALQVVASVVAAAAALALLGVRRRIAGALLLGVVGFAAAVIYADRGAPDLALTQMLVETVVIVAFVLLLRRLPVRAPAVTRRGRRVLRAAAAVGAGGFVTGLGMVVAAAPAGAPVGAEAFALAPAAGGANAVNVILTEFRALDTLGEITVVAVGVLGVLRLVAVARTAPSRRREPGWACTTPTSPGRAALLPHPPRAFTRLVEWLVPPLVAFAVYLLVAGHNRPGGGFAAGLVAGATIVLRGLAARRRSPHLLGVAPQSAVACGLGLAIAVGLVPVALGGAFLESASAELTLPVLGAVKAPSSLVFDVGVALVVTGVVAGAAEALGAARPSRETPAAEVRA